MKSKFISRKSSRQGNSLINSFAKSVVKGGPAKKKVKTMSYTTTTDYGNKKLTGSGTIKKKVYKKGVLVKNKTKKMTMGKMLRNP